ncbi:MAG: hypothetical protein RJB13_1396 [Pseudomonadota bacterium]
MYPAFAVSHLRLILNLRWIAVASQLVVLFPAIKLGWVQIEVRLYYVLLVSFLAGLNTASVFAERVKFIRSSQSQLFAQLSFDLLVVCGLLWLTGGAWNPFIVLTLIHAVLAGMMLRGLHLVFYVLTYFWALSALYSNPMLPPPVLGQTLPSVVLYPVHMLTAASLIGLIAWTSFQLEKKRREVEVAQDDARKQEHLRAFGVIATGFSHELATPLSTLQLRLNRLARANPHISSSDDYAAASEAAEACTAALKQLLRRRNDLSNCSFENVDLNEQLQELKQCWTKADHTLELAVASNPVQLRTPVVSLKQVIDDLVDNACRAKANAAIKISTKNNESEGSIELHIEDDGPGVPQVIKDHLGEPFFTAREGGHGLGLFNAYAYAKAMGGILHINDRPQGGTRVSLVFPRVQASL